jgi:hypothetical protein
MLRRYTDDGVRKGPPELEAQGAEHVCDWCGDRIDGTPAAKGLFLWTRGEEVRYEEPPLCEDCASSIAFGARLEDGLDEE